MDCITNEKELQAKIKTIIDEANSKIDELLNQNITISERRVKTQKITDDAWKETNELLKKYNHLITQ